jgi:hypothetical protein
MESQIVVDHTEVDGNGFVIGGSSNDSHPDELWTQIRSLELRAKSRDTERLTSNESSEDGHQYMLRLESRELRHQAARLRKQLGGMTVDDVVGWSGVREFVEFGGPAIG